MQGFERIQWDEEQHPGPLGSRDNSDGMTFSDAGLTATPDIILGTGNLYGAARVPNTSHAHPRPQVRR
jgi:hypothetical protein